VVVVPLPEMVVPVDPGNVLPGPVVPEPPLPDTVVVVEVELDVEVDVPLEEPVGNVVVARGTVVVVVAGGAVVVVVVVLTGVALGTNTSPCGVWRTTPEPVDVDWGD